MYELIWAACDPGGREGFLSVFLAAEGRNVTSLGSVFSYALDWWQRLIKPCRVAPSYVIGLAVPSGGVSHCPTRTTGINTFQTAHFL